MVAVMCIDLCLEIQWQVYVWKQVKRHMCISLVPVKDLKQQPAVSTKSGVDLAPICCMGVQRKYESLIELGLQGLDRGDPR